MRVLTVRREGGHVAIEFALAIGLLLLPVVLLVAALPSWVERQHAATVAAREAASVAAASYPAEGREAARLAAAEAVANHGVSADDMTLTFDRYEMQRGGMVSARVSIRMPAIVVP